jgi:DNA-binding beta-propeller fold protein YncE
MVRHGVAQWAGIALLLGLTTGAGAQPLRPIALIEIPGAPLESFDISWMDTATQTYYLADRSNAGIDVIDATTHTFVKRIGGFVGIRGKNDVSGPAGVVLVPERHELWVGDGNSTVKVVDLQAGTIVATISTGGTKRADELDYDPVDHVVLVTNPDDDPAFATFISTQTRNVLGSLPFPEATDGIEQPVWDPDTPRFYQAVPETKAHPGGAVAVIDPRAMTVTALYPVASCRPHGLAVGPTEDLLLGCSSGKDARSIILNRRTGTVVETLTQVGGSDQVWYNPGDHRYYLAARENPGGPVLGVIDALTHQWLMNIPTAKNAHSVAVNAVANEVFVPLTPNPACARGCVAVYRVGP